LPNARGRDFGGVSSSGYPYRGATGTRIRTHPRIPDPVRLAMRLHQIAKWISPASSAACRSPLGPQVVMINSFFTLLIPAGPSADCEAFRKVGKFAGCRPIGGHAFMPHCKPTTWAIRKLKYKFEFRFWVGFRPHLGPRPLPTTPA
jgi:hypothetical protein